MMVVAVLLKSDFLMTNCSRMQVRLLLTLEEADRQAVAGLLLV